MMKGLGILALTLVAVGVGFSLYLPPHSSNGSIIKAPVPHFVLIEGSLETPYPADTLRHSLQVFSSTIADESEYGLQLGIFGSTEDAIAGSNVIPHTLFTTLPITPAIFKVESDQRQWLVLALGPFKTNDESLRYQRLLTDHYIDSSSILWPTTKEAASK
jgi:hypothetical protein